MSSLEMVRTVLRIEGISKAFAGVAVLRGATLEAHGGEAIALMGANGAGKSTLMNILGGNVAADQGRISINGADVEIRSAREATLRGIAFVHQELAMLPTLTVAENIFIDSLPTSGPFISIAEMRRRSQELMGRLGSTVSPESPIEELSIGDRQLVEIARALRHEPRIIIFDEPTSSLDTHRATQLLSYVRRTIVNGASCVLISHLLGEILEYSDRIVVMRDGKVVVSDRASVFDRDKLVTAMGATVGPVAAKEAKKAPRGSTPVRIRARPATQTTGGELIAHEGEIVGLAGLSGHGQTDLLLSIFKGSTRRVPGISISDPVAMVAGDRQSDGIFPLWSIAENIGVRSIAALRRGPLISPGLENRFAEWWRDKIRIRTSDLHNNILSLSGGNQQKALFARALGSDAKIVLMDDPMRGVDIGTKLEVYQLIRTEAAGGRTFLWYTTEMEELQNCDHVYVFRNGRIVADLRRDELSEERVIQSSFEEVSRP